MLLFLLRLRRMIDMVVVVLMPAGIKIIHWIIASIAEEVFITAGVAGWIFAYKPASARVIVSAVVA